MDADPPRYFRRRAGWVLSRMLALGVVWGWIWAVWNAGVGEFCDESGRWYNWIQTLAAGGLLLIPAMMFSVALFVPIRRWQLVCLSMAAGAGLLGIPLGLALRFIIINYYWYAYPYAYSVWIGLSALGGFVALTALRLLLNELAALQAAGAPVAGDWRRDSHLSRSPWPVGARVLAGLPTLILLGVLLCTLAMKLYWLNGWIYGGYYELPVVSSVFVTSVVALGGGWLGQQRSRRMAAAGANLTALFYLLVIAVAKIASFVFDWKINALDSSDTAALIEGCIGLAITLPALPLVGRMLLGEIRAAEQGSSGPLHGDSEESWSGDRPWDEAQPRPPRNPDA